MCTTRQCYFCGSDYTSREHVPPRRIFPHSDDLAELGITEGMRRNLITVPSCDLHNSQRSQDDEYVQYILSFAVVNNNIGLNQFGTRIMDRIRENPSIMRRLYRNSTPAVINGLPTRAFQIERNRFDNVFIHIVKGLFFHKYGEILNTNVVIHTPVLSTNYSDQYIVNDMVANLSNTINQFLDPIAREGENQEVFYYQISRDEERNICIIKMVFYGGFEVFGICGSEIIPSRI